MRNQVGRMIGAGMAKGISDSARQVDAAMAGLNNRLVSNESVVVKSTNNPEPEKEDDTGGDINITVNTNLDGKRVASSTSKVQTQTNSNQVRTGGLVTA